MALSPERRKQLDDIVVDLANKNAPKEDVQAIVNDFTAKYGGSSSSTRQPIEVTPYKPSGIERLQAFAEKTSAGRFGKAIRGAVTGDGLSPEEQRKGLGTGVQSLANVAALGLGPAGSLRQAATQSAGIAAGSSVGQSVEQGRNPQQTVAAALGSAGIGAAIPAVASKVANRAKNAAQNKAENIYKQVVRTPARQVVAGKEQLGPGLLKREITGTTDEMIQQLTERARKASKDVSAITESAASKRVNLSEVRNSLQALRTQLKKTPGESTEGVDRVLKALKSKNMSVKNAQELKRNLQSAVNIAFTAQNTTGVTQAQKLAAQKVRQAIEKKLPDIAEPNKELEFIKRALPELEKVAAAPDGSRLIQALGRAMAGLKTGAAAATAPLNPTAAGALAAETLIQRALNNQGAQTKNAVRLARFAKKELPSQLRDVIQRQLAVRSGQ